MEINISKQRILLILENLPSIYIHNSIWLVINRFNNDLKENIVEKNEKLEIK